MRLNGVEFRYQIRKRIGETIDQILNFDVNAVTFLILGVVMATFVVQK